MVSLEMLLKRVLKEKATGNAFVVLVRDLLMIEGSKASSVSCPSCGAILRITKERKSFVCVECLHVFLKSEITDLCIKKNRIMKAMRD